MIPKIFHFVWVGDPTKEPHYLINSWRQLHPDHEIKIYRNEELFSRDWHFKDKMNAYFKQKQYCGVADLIRWEVLAKEGGIALDADSLCLKHLPDWIYSCSIAACWDNSHIEGTLLSNGFVAALPQNATILKIIDLIDKNPFRTQKWRWSKFKNVPVGAWRTVGPKILTQAALHENLDEITALPSYFFLPIKSNGQKFQGGGPNYACQFWLSTHNQNIQDIEKEAQMITTQLAQR